MTTHTNAIVALDVASSDSARKLVEVLGDRCDFYKVGLELYAADGPAVVRWLRSQRKRVFVDLKAYDIPNTVRGVARSVASLGASLLTVHASGGDAMIAAAVEGAGAQDGSGCGILAVTVLTSFDAGSYGRAVGRDGVDVGAEVLRLAGAADRAGAHGVVCSGLESRIVVDHFEGRVRTLVPGVRLESGPTHDQARVVTPAGAAAAGASYIVLGRAVTAAADPRAALESALAASHIRT
ncbi:MAG TPA: orotidine-5'-phosphate decarboxylase [Gemmatimonadaceae bacterium]|nr:orotidine-5'-phosphate decarboxylase [Gemmatimonadaceae bacterium]